MPNAPIFKPAGLCLLAFTLTGATPPPEHPHIGPLWPKTIYGIPLESEQAVEIPAFPDASKISFVFDHAGLLLTPELLKGYAGMPAVKVDAYSFLKDGEMTEDSVASFREWMAAAAPTVAERMDEAEYGPMLATLVERTGKAYVQGQEKPKYIFFNLSSASERRLMSSNVLQIMFDAHDAANVYEAVPMLGGTFKPRALLDAFWMARVHGFFSDARVEAFVSWSFVGRPENAKRVFLTWYAQAAAVNPETEHEKMAVLSARLEKASTALVELPEADRLPAAARMLKANKGKGIEAAFARAWLGAQPQLVLSNAKINLFTPLGGYVEPYAAAVRAAPKLAPRR